MKRGTSWTQKGTNYSRRLARFGGGVDEHGRRFGRRALAVDLLGYPLLQGALHLLLDVQEADAGQIVAAQPTHFGFGLDQAAGDGQLEAQLDGGIERHRPVELERHAALAQVDEGAAYRPAVGG